MGIVILSKEQISSLSKEELIALVNSIEQSEEHFLSDEKELEKQILKVNAKIEEKLLQAKTFSQQKNFKESFIKKNGPYFTKKGRR